MVKVLGQYKALMPAVQHATQLLTEKASGRADQHVVFDIDDTLIFDDNRQTPNVQIKHLLDVVRAYGYKVHLVTARQRSADVSRWTREELRRQGIQYDTLALAPESARATLASVAKWKHSQRSKHQPCVMSIGDQWGDILLIESDVHLESLNKVHDVRSTPWLIMEPQDKVTLYGFKLMA